MALKREETARKRRNLTEKKLEDEKVRSSEGLESKTRVDCCYQAETINRLLKKQSRTRGKRNALSTAEDRPTPVSNSREGELEMEEGEEGVATPVIPTMYRWISTSRTLATPDGTKGKQEPRMTLSFSVPVTALPPSVSAGTDVPMRDSINVALSPPPVEKAICDIEGCGAQRKYRLVKDWQKGACGLPHLKALETKLLSA